MIDWEKVKVFSPNDFDDPDFPGSGVNLDPVLLLELVLLVERTGWKIKPHWEVGGCVDVLGNHGHAPRSFHRLDQGAKAVDFHFETRASSREQFYAVRHGRFTGLGVYYDWRWGGRELPIGFHVDTRPVERNQMWVREGRGSYLYLLK